MVEPSQNNFTLFLSFTNPVPAKKDMKKSYNPRKKSAGLPSRRLKREKIWENTPNTKVEFGRG